MLSEWRSRPLPVRATQAAVVCKAVIVIGVGIVEYFSAPFYQSIWGRIHAFGPRYLGMVFIMWGVGDLIWQLWLSFRLRRAWWYAVLSSAGIASSSVVLSDLSVILHPGLLRLAGAVGICALIFLIVFQREFSVR